MNELLDPRPGIWTLHVLPQGHPRHLLVLAAKFAERSPLIVLDCGRQFDATIIARAAGGREEITDRIHIQRAFICSEVARLVQTTWMTAAPVLILDLLSTFYDENVRIRMRKYLLETILLHLKRMSRGAGLAVSVHLPPDASDSIQLFERLLSCAPQVLTYETPRPDSRQLDLF